MSLICRKCGTNHPDEDTYYFEYHHIHPLSGWPPSGETVMLCRRCHDIIHHKLVSVIGYALQRKYRGVWLDIDKEIDTATRKWLTEGKT
jgi:predicted HNH restriction endonuclease